MPSIPEEIQAGEDSPAWIFFLVFSLFLHIHHFRMLHSLLFLEFLHHLGIAVAKQSLDENIFQPTIEIHLIPILLVPMPGAFYLGMNLPEFEGVIALHFIVTHSGRSRSRQAKILPIIRNTKVVSSKGKSSVTRGSERQYSLIDSMFIISSD